MPDTEAPVAPPAAQAVWSAAVDGIGELQRGLLAQVSVSTGIAAGWYPVMMRLLATPGSRLPMSVLSASQSMTSGGFTKLADRIEAAGLIARVPSEGDRRVVYAELTDTGQLAARHAAELVDAWVRQAVLMQFSREELADIGERLRRVERPTFADPGGPA